VIPEPLERVDHPEAKHQAGTEVEKHQRERPDASPLQATPSFSRKTVTKRRHQPECVQHAQPHVLCAHEAEMRADFIRSASHIARVCRAYDVYLQDAPQDFSRLQVPVDVLWGTSRMHFAAAHGHSLASAAAKTTFTSVAGGGHWMVMSHVEAIAARFARVLGS
jgi:pimeloyl-ACP methyl ester carboxylesterase